MLRHFDFILDTSLLKLRLISFSDPVKVKVPVKQPYPVPVKVHVPKPGMNTFTSSKYVVSPRLQDI